MTLLNKSDVGAYTYPASGAGAIRPHALQSMAAINAGGTTNYTYDANGNLVSASAGKYRTMAYTSFNLPDSQSGIGGAPAGSSGGTARYTWVYDENHQRIKEVRTIAGGTLAGTRTTWFLHPDNAGNLGFEYEVDAPTTPTTANPTATNARHYLSFGGQTLGVLVSAAALPTIVGGQTAPPVLASIALNKVEYWHKDHLGSLSATTDHNGVVTARYAYDPFGKRRYTNGSYDPFGAIVVDFSPATNSGTDRGFTEHEHLDDIGIIHMNGRLFDPTLGRFLQSDPNVTNVRNQQNYNRYAYCLNDASTCTDPTGFDVWDSNDWGGIGDPTADPVVGADSGGTSGSDGDLSQAGDDTGQKVDVNGKSLKNYLPDWNTFKEKLFSGCDSGKFCGTLDATKIRAGAQVVIVSAKSAYNMWRAVKMGRDFENKVRQLYGIGATGFFRTGLQARFPDNIDRVKRTISEMKNVQAQDWTAQLQDYAKFAQEEGLTFNLYIRKGADMSESLLAAAKNGLVNIIEVEAPRLPGIAP